MLGFTKTRNIHKFNLKPKPTIIQKPPPIIIQKPPPIQKDIKFKIIILIDIRNKYEPIEHMVSIYNVLTEWGYTCYIENVNSNKNYSNDNFNLYIGFVGYNIEFYNLPKKYIMINGEPINSLIGCNIQHVAKLKNAIAILHYNSNDIETLKNKYNKSVFYFPYTYHHTIENFYKVNTEIKEDIDVLFVGTSSIIKPNFGSHRIDTLTKLINTDLNIFITGWNMPFLYNKERDILIRRAKIILLINFYDENVDTFRATHLIANKRFLIIDSWKGGETLSNVYNKIIPCVNSDDLYKTIKYYLNNDEERKKIIEKGYNYVKENFKMETYIKKIPFFNKSKRSRWRSIS